MTDRFREFVKGIGALLALLLLLVGPPLALAAGVGWPLPRGVPTWSEVADVLGGARLPDGAVVKVLACGCWIAWALFAASVVHETLAWAHGRSARSIALTGGFQTLARRLVMAATLVVALARSAPAHTVALPAAVPAVATTPAPVPVEAPTPAPTPVPALPNCTVQPRDSLWRLAENHLGDGMRWRDIWDLNHDRVQVDGVRFTDPDLIHPGWVLTMPADAVGLPGVEAPVTTPASVPSPPPVVDSAPPPAPTTFPSPATTTTIEPATTTTVAPTYADPSAVEPDADSGDPDADVTPLLAGAALVAAGVVATLDHYRRRRAAHGSRVAPPESLRASEVALRRAADERTYTRLDLVLRNLAHQLELDPGPPPSIDVVSVGPVGVEVILDRPSTAPDGPFEVTAEGRAWTLPSAVEDADLEPVARKITGPAPALATIGTVEERTVLVDLETVPVTVVNGDPDDATALLGTIALDLATSDRADDLDLVLVGDVPAGLEALTRGRTVASVEDLLPELDRQVERAERDLRSMKVATVSEARVRGLGEGVAPTVVIVFAAGEGGQGLAELAAIARRRIGIGVLVATDEIDADRELCVEDDTLVVKPLGLRLAPSALPVDVTVDAAALVVDATDESTDLDLRDEPAAAPAAPELLNGHGQTVEFVLRHDAAGDPIVPEGHVVIRVCGGVEIFGGERHIDRRRSAEFVVYLALHPDGVDEDQIRQALWPEMEPTRSTFNETISFARRCLGPDPTGEHHVRHFERGRYRLGPYVHLERARPARDGDQLALPFRGCPGYEWAYTEGIAYNLESVADGTAAVGGAFGSWSPVLDPRRRSANVMGPSTSEP